MKTFILVLGLAGALTLAGCSDGGSNFGGGSLGGGDAAGGGSSAGDLQAFVLSNCKSASQGDAALTDGQAFPVDANTDATQSVYTQNCVDAAND